MSTCLEVVTAAIVALNPGWTDDKVEKYAEPICIEAEKRDIDPLIGVAIIHHETGWRPKLTHKNKNGSVDYGLMQFNCRSLDKINLKWRKWWCDPKRRNYLMTVEGNIKAGFRELYFWKEQVCFKKHMKKEGARFLYNWTILDLMSGNSVDCRDCFQVSLDPYIGTSLDRMWRLKSVLKSQHWWVRHYNWRSVKHWRSVLYIYKILLERRVENYPMLRNGYYRKLAKKKMLDDCLLREDMCLSEYEEWQRKQNLKTESKSLKQKSSSWSLKLKYFWTIMTSFPRSLML